MSNEHNISLQEFYEFVKSKHPEIIKSFKNENTPDNPWDCEHSVFFKEFYEFLKSERPDVIKPFNCTPRNDNRAFCDYVFHDINSLLGHLVIRRNPNNKKGFISCEFYMDDNYRLFYFLYQDNKRYIERSLSQYPLIWKGALDNVSRKSSVIQTQLDASNMTKAEQFNWFADAIKNFGTTFYPYL